MTMMRTAFQEGMEPLEPVDSRLATAIGDLLSRPGSLLRATTAYLIGLETGSDEATARGLGCGIEYLHTASLVFDDLPAMDDARIRRGAPCVHVTHGEGIAMLAALALVNRGYSLIWRAVATAPAERRTAAGNLVDECLGLAGLVDGQARDLRGWRGEQDAAAVLEVAARKTAALVRLPVVLPAMIGGAADGELRLLDRLAFLRGLAYQVADDLKDVMQADAESGKTAGRDEALGRPNLVAAEGVSGALARFHRLQSLGDRIHARLPDSARRWWMLDFLRVSSPWTVIRGEEGLATG